MQGNDENHLATHLAHQSRRIASLLRKGITSLRSYGIRATWQRVLLKFRMWNAAKELAKRPLFSKEELAAQRAHRFPQSIRFSIVVPLYNTPETFLRAMIDSVLEQTYTNWELCMADGSDAGYAKVGRICQKYAQRDSRILYQRLDENHGISGNTNACLAMATGDYIGLFDHDDLLHPAALHEVAQAICETGADFVYTDENTFVNTPRDAYNPHFKPSYAPDTLCSNNYICHFTVFKRSLLDEVGLFEPTCDGAQDHDMVLRLTEKAQRVAHIPEILYYWRAHPGSVAESTGVKPYAIDAGVRAVERCLERKGLRGTVSPTAPGLTIYRVRYEIEGTPLVSILIPTYEHLEDLRACLDSLFEKTSYANFEIVLVENNSSSVEVFDYYEAVQREHGNIRVVRWSGEFNYAEINNFGAQYCTGDYLVLLNNDITVITPDWLQEMLMFAQRRDVGAVGAKLHYPDGTIQHAGVCLGMGGVAAHYFGGVDNANVGYMGRLIYAQNLSAVTAACMMIRREVWEEVGGFDDEFAVAYNDVDLCMRIRKAGYLVVWTPYAELIHYESKSRGTDDTPKKKARFEQEQQLFLERWHDELEAGDRYFSPSFLLDRNDFAINPFLKPHRAR